MNQTDTEQDGVILSIPTDDEQTPSLDDQTDGVGDNHTVQVSDHHQEENARLLPNDANTAQGFVEKTGKCMRTLTHKTPLSFCMADEATREDYRRWGICGSLLILTLLGTVGGATAGAIAATSAAVAMNTTLIPVTTMGLTSGPTTEATTDFTTATAATWKTIATMTSEDPSKTTVDWETTTTEVMTSGHPTDTSTTQAMTSEHPTDTSETTAVTQQAMTTASPGDCHLTLAGNQTVPYGQSTNITLGLTCSDKNVTVSVDNQRTVSLQQGDSCHGNEQSLECSPGTEKVRVFGNIRGATTTLFTRPSSNNTQIQDNTKMESNQTLTVT